MPAQYSRPKPGKRSPRFQRRNFAAQIAASESVTAGLLFRVSGSPKPALPKGCIGFAAGLGVKPGGDEDTVLRWWHEGLPTGVGIPRACMRPRGSAGYLFHPAFGFYSRATEKAVWLPGKEFVSAAFRLCALAQFYYIRAALEAERHT